MKKNISFLRLVLLFVFATFLHGVVMAQTKKVTGVVKDEAGEALIGVSVQVKGTAVGSMTDFNGAYNIDVPEGSTTLVFSYIGMKTQELPISGEFVSATLVSDTKELDDVVVVGYGTVKRRDLTGAVASLKTRDLQSVASNNAMEAMQGKIAGMDISRSSGAAGSDLEITLRGNRSVNASNDPLIIVDGVEFGSTIDINASDIASMEILKDASSTAIYGTRGANGVIIITTKRGSADAGTKKTLVSYNNYVSFNSPTLIPKTMSPQQDVNFLIEKERYKDDVAAGKNWGSTPVDKYNANSILSSNDSALYANGTNVDWFDLFLSNTISHNHELSVVGGTEKTKYNFSLGYLDEKGLMKNDGLKRYNVKFGIDHEIIKNLNIDANIFYTRREWDRREDNVWNQILKMHSLADTTAEKPTIDLANSHSNPLINEYENYYVNNTKSNRIFANGAIKWNIIKGLQFKSLIAADIYDMFKGVYEDYQIASRYQSSPYSYMSQENKTSYDITWDNTLTYDVKIKGGHDLTALLGTSANQYKSIYGKTSGTGGGVHYLTNLYYDLTKVSTMNAPESEYIKSSLMSYFGRVNYKYKDRYLLTGTLRADGSSTLAEGNQWGYFPSVGTGWRVSSEKFMKNVKAINNLKLRYSWGKAGNAAIDPYGTLALTSPNRNYYCFDNVSVFGFVPGNLGNKELSWETTTTHNIGLDFSIFKDRISGTVDYYISSTSDLLMEKSVPPTTGYTKVLENVGETKGNGIEVVITSQNIKKKDFNWTSDWTFSLMRDEVVSLASGATQDFSDPEQALKVGSPVSCFADYEVDGVFGINDPDLNAFNASMGFVPGMLKVVDQNGDSLITDEDRILYNRSPKFILGWNNSFSYKNFTLSIFAFARVGQWIAYDLYDQFKPTEQDATADLDYWTPENQSARFPRPGIDPSPYKTALNKVNASYVKIRDISLSYSLPKKIVKSIGMSDVRVFGSLKNFFTFSNIDNYDPEQNGSISNPLMKQVVCGLNLSF